MKTVLKDWNRALSGAGDDIKIKSKVSPFFFLYPFSLLSLPSFLYILPFIWLGGGLNVWWNQGEIRVTGGDFFSTIFINPDIYLFIILQLNSVLRSETRTVWISAKHQWTFGPCTYGWRAGNLNWQSGFSRRENNIVQTLFGFVTQSSLRGEPKQCPRGRLDAIVNWNQLTFLTGDDITLKGK